MSDPQQDAINIQSSLNPLVDQSRSLNRRLQDMESTEGTRLASLVSTTASPIFNSNAVNNLYLSSLRANTLRTNQVVHGYVPFIYINPTGSPSTLKFGVLYGGAGILSFDTISPTNGAPTRLGHLELYIWGNGLVTAQAAFGRLVIGPLTGSPTTDQFEFFASGALTTIDSTQDQTLAVTVQHGTADPTIGITGQLILLTGPYIP